MKNFYFTFGQDHHTTDGVDMMDYYVRVIADDYMTARKLFVRFFSSVFMEAADKWAFQYDEEHFTPEYFRNGEYQTINA